MLRTANADLRASDLTTQQAQAAVRSWPDPKHAHSCHDAPKILLAVCEGCIGVWPVCKGPYETETLTETEHAAVLWIPA